MMEFVENLYRDIGQTLKNFATNGFVCETIASIIIGLM